MDDLIRCEVNRLKHVDPRLAFGLARCSHTVQAFGGNVELSSVNVPTPVTFEQVPDFAFIKDLSYDVDMPNYTAGAARAQEVYYNALNPGIDLKIQINQGYGPRNQVLNQSYRPIQHLVRHATSAADPCCDWLRGKLIYAWQTFTMSALLKRALVGNRSPYVVSFALKAVIVEPDYAAFTRDDAIGGLSGLGFDVGDLK